MNTKPDKVEFFWLPSAVFVYYESIKRELKRRLIYEYRCDERLKTKNEESTDVLVIFPSIFCIKNSFFCFIYEFTQSVFFLYQGLANSWGDNRYRIGEDWK
jgi:hypothetical protein